MNKKDIDLDVVFEEEYSNDYYIKKHKDTKEISKVFGCQKKFFWTPD